MENPTQNNKQEAPRIMVRCETCGQGFALAKDLIFHLAREHSVNSEDNQPRLQLTVIANGKDNH